MPDEVATVQVLAGLASLADRCDRALGERVGCGPVRERGGRDLEVPAGAGAAGVDNAENRGVGSGLVGAVEACR